MSRPVVCIEGNIGSGKSSVLEALQVLHPDWLVIHEPLSDWRPWLDQFYSNKARWAFALQMRILASYASVGNTLARLQAGDSPASSGLSGAGTPIIVERSCESCRYVFGQIMFNSSFMSEKEWNLFKRFYDLVAWRPDVSVYVQTPPDLCLARVEGVACGDLPDLEYLRRIEFQYQNMLNFCQGKRIAVDGRGDPAEMARRISDALCPP